MSAASAGPGCRSIAVTSPTNTISASLNALQTEPGAAHKPQAATGHSKKKNTISATIWASGARGRSHLTTCVRSEEREMGEDNQTHKREHPPKDADQQPEVGPAQLKQSVSAYKTGRRSPLSLMGQTVCSHMAPRRDTPTGLTPPRCGCSRNAYETTISIRYATWATTRPSATIFESGPQEAQAARRPTPRA